MLHSLCITQPKYSVKMNDITVNALHDGCVYFFSNDTKRFIRSLINESRFLHSMNIRKKVDIRVNTDVEHNYWMMYIVNGKCYSCGHDVTETFID